MHFFYAEVSSVFLSLFRCLLLANLIMSTVLHDTLELKFTKCVPFPNEFTVKRIADTVYICNTTISKAPQKHFIFKSGDLYEQGPSQTRFFDDQLIDTIMGEVSIRRCQPGLFRI